MAQHGLGEARGEPDSNAVAVAGPVFGRGDEFHEGFADAFGFRGSRFVKFGLQRRRRGRQERMGGGTIRGWFPDVAVVLWRRMLGALGDVNRLPDPNIHAQVFEYLVELWDTLAKIYANQGVPEEGNTPPPPTLTPPLTLFAPWCFKALDLPDSYQRGKVNAYRLLCRMALGAGTWSLSSGHLAHLYRALHTGLAGPHPVIVYTLLKSLGPRFLSRQLPGYSLLLLDLISASNAVLESSDLQTAPRLEAASILGSVLSLPYMVSQAPSLDPRSPSLGVLNCAGAKDLVIASLLRCAKREVSGTARSTALSALAAFAYTELSGSSPHPSVESAFDVILLALRFKQRAVGFVACDLLFALADHSSCLFSKFPSIPRKVVKALANALGCLGTNSGPLGPVLAITLGEWAMRFPVDLLLTDKQPDTLLLIIFTVLNELANGADSVDVSPAEFPKEMTSDWENSVKVDDLRSSRKLSDQSWDKNNLALACRAVLMHLVSHLGHFPMGLGAARLSSLVQEHDDVPELGNELSMKLFFAPNVQFMLVRNSLMSMIEVEYLQAPGGGFTAGLATAQSQARVLLRDLANKASWDASALYCTPQDLSHVRKIPRSRCYSKEKAEEPPMSLLMQCTPPRCTLRHRPPHILPDFSNAAPDMDSLHDLLRYIGYTSSECLENPDLNLSEPGPTPPPLMKQIEAEVISAILAQRTYESDYKQFSEPTKKSCPPREPEAQRSPFQQCRQLLSQLGLTGWERRPQIQLLAPSERLLRELRNLDTQRGRETHKVAVIYVAAGQEDKTSILSNKGGSQAYEQFVAGLAWEVELASHTGFSGGLGSGCGDTAPYYATAFTEMLFHVSTRMPSDTEESLLQKMRHLGNDEVHVVWSEHNRDYRRSSLPTEFCDVLIVVYPLPDSLYRVTVDTKSEMPVFGPLWNEAIVEGRALAGLVRATAAAASRAKRRTLPHYQTYYQERFTSLSGVIENHKDPRSFEEFIAAVHSPGTASSGQYRTGQPPLAKALIDPYTKSECPSVRWSLDGK
ncbi:UNVERIFIED_CONTAM: hypothetical protein PYX00_007629 [Menopon gallinae]|uniref:Rap-GAP domain-containing protein n=1 Tax=Menopon gallinae TaxID=328185 RepID=A0AAW2HJM8_9NEOP